MAESLDVRLNHPVQALSRVGDKVVLSSRGETSSYDAVVLAAHAPDTLHMLADADRLEREILGSVRQSDTQWTIAYGLATWREAKMRAS